MICEMPPPALVQAMPAPPSATGFRAVALRASPLGHLQVRGTINGMPVEILIDTGASGTVVDRGWAQAHGLTLRPTSGTGGGVGGGALKLSRVNGVHLTVGDIALPGVAIIAIDLSSISAQLKASKAVPPQVVIGYDVLKRWRAVIDYGTATLWLAPEPR